MVLKASWITLLSGSCVPLSFCLFVGNKLVTARNSHIDANTVLISFVMGVVRLFDRHIAAVNVIAKFFQPRALCPIRDCRSGRIFPDPDN